MNRIITAGNKYASLLGDLHALFANRQVFGVTSYEVEDNVIRGGGFAWDLPTDAAALSLRLDQIDAAEQQAVPGTGSASPILPMEVPAWRIKALAKIQGLTPAIDSVLASLPEPQRTVATFAWNEGNVIARNSETTIAIGSAIGLTSQQMDDLFISAAAMNV